MDTPNINRILKELKGTLEKPNQSKKEKEYLKRLIRKYEKLKDVKPKHLPTTFEELTELAKTLPKHSGKMKKWTLRKVVSSKPATPGRRPHPPGFRTGSAKRSTKRK